MRKEPRRQLISLVRTHDGAGLVAMLHDPWPEHSLQVIGEGLAEAVRAGLAGAGPLATRCADRLVERGWAGDRILAQAIDATLRGVEQVLATEPLRPLPVDLEMLAGVMEGDPIEAGGWLDLTTGEAWPGLVFEDREDFDRDELDDPALWLNIPNEGSGDGYQDMVDFIRDEVDDERLAARLDRALSGRGPFRRFRDVLWHEEELLTEWHAYSDERHLGRARRWLAEEGYAACPLS